MASRERHPYSDPMLPDSSQIFASPDYHCIGFGQHHAHFVEMDREHYRQSIFLDRRVAARSQASFDLPLPPLIAEAARTDARPAAWIFHIAHCGSTLLANLLDQPGQTLALREPPSLRQIGIERGNGASEPLLKSRLTLAHRLCSRRYSDQEVPLIKANVPVNFILDLIDAEQADAPAVMLFLNWRAYLIAILRTDNHRTWVGRITSTFRGAIENKIGVGMGDGVAERAAALWLSQMKLYADYMQRNPNAAALDTQHLFDHPVATATSVARHLGLAGVEPARNAEALTSYSKDPSRRFDSNDRNARASSDEQRLSGELALAESWLNRAAAAGSLFDGFARTITP